MSNRDKMIVVEDKEETPGSSEGRRNEDSPVRQIVLALPALRINQTVSDTSVVAGEQQAHLNEQAVRVTAEEQQTNEQAAVAAMLILAAANESVLKERSDGKKKQVRKPKKMKKMSDLVGGPSAGEGEKPKKKALELTNPPKGGPTCKICGRVFGSMKAVHGHMRVHRERNFHVLRPLPPKSSVAQGYTIPGPNSAFAAFVGGGGGSAAAGSHDVASGSGSLQGGEDVRGMGIDLNIDLPDKKDEEEKMVESEAVAKFDLNMAPAEDEEEEDKAN